jgi:hypothetical protein
VISFFIETPERERMRRMLWRGDAVDTIIERLKLDREHFAGVETCVDYVIENRDRLQINAALGSDLAAGKIVDILGGLGVAPIPGLKLPEDVHAVRS